MDFAQTLDPFKLVLAGTGLSFFISLSEAPSYNLPLFLFGCYAQEAAEGSQSLQTFAGLLAISFIFDIVWMIKNYPTCALRQRTGQFGGFGSNALGGPTVWSMPGGFTSNGREGYQTVDDEAFVRNVRPVPSVPPKNAPSVPPAEPVAPGAYQTV